MVERPQRIGTDRQCRRAGAAPACEDAASGPASADFEHVVDLPLTARRFLASLLRGLTLLLADEGKSGAKVLVLDDQRWCRASRARGNGSPAGRRDNRP